MEKPISRQLHGFIDYAYVPLVAAAPRLVGFDSEKTAARLTRIISGGVLITTLCTRAEWGLVKAIPFKTHLVGDQAVSVLALTAPWVFGFSGNPRARTTFIAIGVLGILVGLLTQPAEMPATR